MRRPIPSGLWRWVTARADGGVFSGSYGVIGGVKNVVPVDLHIRGCPPRPVDLLKGLLALLEPNGEGNANNRLVSGRKTPLAAIRMI